MWKKGEIVWVSLNLLDNWIPGRILDPSVPFGVQVSFFGLMDPRYVPKPCIRSFDRDFGALISDSWSFRRFVNRALRAHFWNISFGLWCSCQSPIESPHFDRENSLPWFPSSSDSALSYVRDVAVSLRMPLRRLAETNSSSAQILSFRRYIVDFKLSESVYEEITESAKVMDESEEAGWYLDHSNKVDSVDRDPLPKDIHCYVSPSADKPVDKKIQVYTWNTRNTLTNSGSSILKACETKARREGGEDDGHLAKRRRICPLEQSICVLNSEAPGEDIIEEGTTSLAGPRVAAVSGAPPDFMIKTSDDRTVTSAELLIPTSNNKAILAKPIAFSVPGACKTLARSVKEAYASTRNKLNSSVISAKTLDGESLERFAIDGTREHCYDDAIESNIVEVRQVSRHTSGTSVKEFSCDDVGIAPAKQSQDLDTTVDTAIAVENQTEQVDNVRSIGVKRKANQDKVAAGKSKRKKKAGQQSNSTDEPLNVLKDMRLAKPKCLRMKFLSKHGNLPSKLELLKRFSVFGKIDASRTDVNPEKSSAKVVFLQSIDAVTAYQFARSKKFTLGPSKVMYQLDPFEQDSEINKAPLTPKPQQTVPSPTSCLKKPGTPDKEMKRRNLKVKFKMETTNS